MRKDRIFIQIGILGLACLVLTSVRSSSMQGDEKWLPGQVGKWKPLTMDLECCRQDYKLTQREFATYMEKLKRLAGITRELKVLSPPLGVEAHNSLSIPSPPYSGVQKPRSYIPVVGLVRLILVPYFASEDGGIDLDPDNGAWLTFYINDLVHIFRGERYTHKGVVEDWLGSGEPPEMEDEQGLYFLAPKVVGDLQGFPIYDTAAVIFVKSQKPLWVPVSQERFLRHALRRAQELLETQKEELRKAMEGAPPDVVREAEQARREGDATTRASLAETPGFIRFLRADYVKALTQELASLSPAERAAPAYYSPDWKTTRRPSGLLDPAAPQAQPVVSPNPDFFNPALPRTATQVIVMLGISGRERPPAHLEKANPAVARRFEVRETLDWRKIAALVE
jgi:hypothetical protein